MIEVTFTYNEDDLAWESENIALGGDIRLYVKLKEQGIIIIFQKDNETGEWPKVSMSIPSEEAEYLISRETIDKTMMIATSTEPEYIRYENL